HLVDGVVDDLPEEVVEARLVDPADVHAGAAANGLEALEYCDRFGVIGRRGHGPIPWEYVLQRILGLGTPSCLQMSTAVCEFTSLCLGMTVVTSVVRLIHTSCLAPC